jgi:phosphoribosylformimino-5-aminoimidazole carboxamide ribotide isomerase
VKVIPVIDIFRGTAVHARRGDRMSYRPIRSALLNSADPLALLRAYRRTFDSTSAYVADLDAIMGLGNNLGAISEMAAAEPQLELFVDGGIRSAGEARRVLESGAKKVIVASESLPSLDVAAGLLAVLGTGRGVFSVDLKERKVIWGGASIELRDPYEVVALLMSLGFREAILLEMDRVGTAAGADARFLGRIARAAPGMKFIVGGGIRTATELARLKRAGASGVLLATSLHDGTITKKDLIRVGVNG